MLSARLGHFLDRPLGPFLKRIKLTPNSLTVIGFVITCIAAVLIPRNLTLGGVFILIGGVFDMIDGIVARTQGQTTKFGAFLDSLLDRYSDGFLFLGISWYFMIRENYTGVLISLGTLMGAYLISYARARAEGLSESCHVGIMERPERILLLIFATLTGWIVPVLWIMFVLTHITVVQRMFHVRKMMRRN
jgi:phosphatidylglycerophosphate synthase